MMQAERSGLSRIGLLGWGVLPVTLIALCLIGMFVAEQSEVVGILAIVCMLGLMAIKAPIAVAMIVPSVVGVHSILGWPATERLLEFRAFDASASWSLSVIPMFVLMGTLLWRSGVTSDVYSAMDATATRVPGRLAVVTNLSGGMLAAISGSTIATTYALGRVGIPEMLRAGYDPRLATSSVLMAGTGGQLMPPSVLLVIYAGIAGVSIGPQLLAGVGPAIVLVLMYTLALILISAVWPHLAGGKSSATELGLGERARKVVAAWPAPLLVVLVLGGIYTGTLTATEAGAGGAIIASLLTLWKKRRAAPVRVLGTGIADTAGATAAIMFLLIGAVFFTQLLQFSGLADGLADWALGADLTRVQVLVVIMVMYIFLGMFMNTLAVILVTVPILMPVLTAADVSMLWFGAFAVLLAELGMITPPVGVLTYIVHGVASEEEVNLGTEIPLGKLFVGVAWLLPATVVVLLLMILFPDIVTWLPERAR